MNIKKLRPGDFFDGIVKITRKAKPGPVIYIVTDGTASIDAVTKDAPFDVEDVVQLQGSVSERAGKLQIEIGSIKKANADFSQIIKEKSKPIDRPLSIQSDRLTKLKPYFLKIAQRIRRAILEGQPLMLRHHADADGISAALAIEHAAKELMIETGIDPAYNLFRSPSKAPFYDTADMLKDIGSAKRLTGQFKQKNPLIIIIDNGSTPEDVFAMKSMHTLGFEIIIMDHHNPVVLENKKTSVCPYVAIHLNPYIEGLDGRTSAGMLCYETARLIHETYDEPFLPAVTGISDHCDIPETDAYIAASGTDKDRLSKIGIAMDFVSYNLRFDSASGMYEELYANPALVDILMEKIQKGMDTQLQSTLPYVKSQDIGGVMFSHIDLERYTVRFTYPTPGKVIGMIHDKLAEETHGPVLSLGYLSDMVIVRATHPVLPVATIIEKLQKKFPEANVDGGGHECAGTLKFVSAHRDFILEEIKHLLKEARDKQLEEAQ